MCCESEHCEAGPTLPCLHLHRLRRRKKLSNFVIHLVNQSQELCSEHESPQRLILVRSRNLVCSLITSAPDEVDPGQHGRRQIALFGEIVKVVREGFVRVSPFVDCDMHKNLPTHELARCVRPAGRISTCFLVGTCGIAKKPLYFLTLAADGRKLSRIDNEALITSSASDPDDFPRFSYMSRSYHCTEYRLSAMRTAKRKVSFTVSDAHRRIVGRTSIDVSNPTVTWH